MPSRDEILAAYQAGPEATVALVCEQDEELHCSGLRPEYRRLLQPGLWISGL